MPSSGNGTWNTGDTITATKLNNIETALTDSVDNDGDTINGNVGIGSTAPALQAAFSGLFVGGNAGMHSQTAASGTNTFDLATNAYYDGAWKYRSDGSAVVMSLVAGRVDIAVASSGSAGGTVSFGTRFQVLNTGYTQAWNGSALADAVVGSATKTTAGAPYANDGYITVYIGGSAVRLMTTA